MNKYRWKSRKRERRFADKVLLFLLLSKSLLHRRENDRSKLSSRTRSLFFSVDSFLYSLSLNKNFFHNWNQNFSLVERTKHSFLLLFAASFQRETFCRVAKRLAESWLPYDRIKSMKQSFCNVENFFFFFFFFDRIENSIFIEKFQFSSLLFFYVGEKQPNKKKNQFDLSSSSLRESFSSFRRVIKAKLDQQLKLNSSRTRSDPTLRKFTLNVFSTRRKRRKSILFHFSPFEYFFYR